MCIFLIKAPKSGLTKVAFGGKMRKRKTSGRQNENKRQLEKKIINKPIHLSDHIGLAKTRECKNVPKCGKERDREERAINAGQTGAMLV